MGFGDTKLGTVYVTVSSTATEKCSLSPPVRRLDAWETLSEISSAPLVEIK